MRLPRRHWLRGGASLLAALPLAGARAAPAPAPEYRRGNDADPETLDPHRSSTVAEAHILRDLFDGLLTYDNHGAIIPGATMVMSQWLDRMLLSRILRNWSSLIPASGP